MSDNQHLRNKRAQRQLRTAQYLKGLGLVGVCLTGFATLRAAESSTTKETFEITLDLTHLTPDALGADPETPWLINMGSINVRNAPATGGSNIVGVLRKDDEMSGDYIIVEQSDEEWLKLDYKGQEAFVSRMGFSRVHPRNQELIDRHGNLPYGEEIVNRWWGIPLDYEADDMVPIPPEYTLVSTRSYPLRQEAMEALVDMLDAMKKDGMEVFISSSYRAGSLQQAMFLKAMRKNMSQRGTAPPGHSEHQLGTTVDITLNKTTRRALRNTDPEFKWLEENGDRFGWRQTYQADNTDETGYIEEPWHWRYMGR